MKIAFYLCEGRNHPNNVIKSAFDYCPFEKDLYWLNDFTGDHATTYDAHVTWGMWKKANPNTNKIKDIAQLSPCHILIEMGYIGKRDKTPDAYYSINIDGLNNWGKEWQTNNIAKLIDCNVVIEPFNNYTGTMIVGQVTRDSTVQHHDHITWLNEKIEQNKNAWLRLHPLQGNSLPVEHDKKCACKSLKSAINNHKIGTLITFNSTSGIEGMALGVPNIIAEDSGSMVYGQKNRDSALIRAASRQFKLDSIPWEQIKKAAHGDLKEV